MTWIRPNLALLAGRGLSDLLGGAGVNAFHHGLVLLHLFLGNGKGGLVVLALIVVEPSGELIGWRRVSGDAEERGCKSGQLS